MPQTAASGAELSKPAELASARNGSGPALSRDKLIQIYRLMYLSRRTDDREIILKSQQKIFFQISGAGHEALLVAAGLVSAPGYDWFFPYYRDRALCLALGVTVEEHAPAGRRRCRRSCQRRPPDAVPLEQPRAPHRHRVFFHSDPMPPGRWLRRSRPLLRRIPKPPSNTRATTAQFRKVEFHGDEVVYVSLGEGATAQGEFWEALNTASNRKLPVIFVVEDNGYAISVPVEVNTPGGNISQLVADFPNFHFAEVDGTDPIACLPRL